MSTGVLPAEKAAAPARPRLGGFDIVERIDRPDLPKGRMQVRVTGAEGTSFAGQLGVATCLATPADQQVRSRLQAVLTGLTSVLHPALVPILDAGIAGNVAYWVSAPQADKSLAQRPDLLPMTPALVRQLLRSLADGLQTAHSRGIGHGAIRLETIYLTPAGYAALDGLSPFGKGAAQDQYDLTLAAIALLRGQPWSPPVPAGEDQIASRVQRAQAIRNALPTCTERVVTVLVKALETASADRYDSMTAFADAFDEAVRYSADDLVHAAFEAISARSPEFASLMYNRAREYDPACESLALLAVQLHGGSIFDPPNQAGSAMPAPAIDSGQFPPEFANLPVAASPVGLAKQASAPAALESPAMTLGPVLTGPAEMVPGQTLPGLLANTSLPLANPEQAAASLLPPELAHGLPPEYLEMVAKQFAVTPPKKGMNPIFVLILGGLGVTILLMVAALVTWSLH